jgi:hypothetical protein
MILESKWEYTKGWHFKDLLRTTWVHDRSVDISKIFWEPLEFMVGVFRWHLILSSWFFCQLEIHGCKLQDKNLRKVWGSRKLKKDRQQNGQRKIDKKTNQRLSRACIVHLVIKKNNWSYVKTMSCVILELRST